MPWKRCSRAPRRPRVEGGFSRYPYHIGGSACCVWHRACLILMFAARMSVFCALCVVPLEEHALELALDV